MQSSRYEEPPLGRPRTARMPKSREERAAQFMPYAALTGFEHYLEQAELESLTNPIQEHSESEKKV